MGNLAGIDPQLPVLFFENAAENPIGAVINFACHQTCMINTEFSGDYSSILAKELKKKYGQDFVYVFLNGTSGDINHIDPTVPKGEKREICMRFGQKLAQEAIRVYETASEIITEDTLHSRKEKNMYSETYGG